MIQKRNVVGYYQAKTDEGTGTYDLPNKGVIQEKGRYQLQATGTPTQEKEERRRRIPRMTGKSQKDS